MDADTSAPSIPLVIVTWLEAVFRDRVPDPETPEYEKNAKAGEQRVVRLIRNVYERQQRGDEDTDT